MYALRPSSVPGYRALLFCVAGLLLCGPADANPQPNSSQIEAIEGGASSSRSCLPYLPRVSSDQPNGQGAERLLDLDSLFSLTEIGGPNINFGSRWGTTGLGVSPDGRFLAFQMRCQDVEQNAYHVGWYTLDLEAPDSDPVFMGEGGSPFLFRGRVGNRISGFWSPTNPKWSPTGDWVAYLRSDGETSQVWRSRPDGTHAEQVTQSDADVEVFYWSDTGDQIWYETDAHPAVQGAFVDALWQGGAWAGDGLFFPLTRSFRTAAYQANDGQPSLWLKDLEGGIERAANESEINAHFLQRQVYVHQTFGRAERENVNPERPGSREYSLSPGSRYATWVESDDLRQSHVFVQDLVSDSAPTACRHDACNRIVRGALFWNRDATELVFARREGEDVRRNVIYAWNFSDDTIRTVHEEGEYHLVNCQSTGRSLICVLLRADYPRVLVEIDFNTGELSQVFDPNPWFEQASVGEAELISWENAYGIRTNGWLVKPADFSPDQRYPLVIVQYNAELCFSGGTGFEHPPQLYAASGMMVLCMSQPRRRQPDEDGQGGDSYFVRQSPLSSWESIIELLADQGRVDPNRVGITAFSMGGDNISYGLSRTQAFSAAISAWLPWASQNYYLKPADGPIGRPRARQSGIGRLGTQDDYNWENMFLGLSADGVQAPILVQVSDAELLQTVFNYVTLQDEGVPIDMYVFRDEYHTKWWPQNRYAAQERSLAWMRFWLQGEVDPGAMSDQQLEHWQGLCEQQITRLAASDDPVLQARSENQPCRRVSTGAH